MSMPVVRTLRAIVSKPPTFGCTNPFNSDWASWRILTGVTKRVVRTRDSLSATHPPHHSITFRTCRMLSLAPSRPLVASQMHPPKCTPTPSPSPAVPPRRVYTRRQQVSVRERAPPFLLLSFGSCSPFDVTCTRYSQIDPGVYRRAYPGQANLYSG